MTPCCGCRSMTTLSRSKSWDDSSIGGTRLDRDGHRAESTSIRTSLGVAAAHAVIMQRVIAGTLVGTQATLHGAILSDAKDTDAQDATSSAERKCPSVASQVGSTTCARAA